MEYENNAYEKFQIELIPSNCCSIKVDLFQEDKVAEDIKYTLQPSDMCIYTDNKYTISLTCSNQVKRVDNLYIGNEPVTVNGDFVQYKTNVANEKKFICHCGCVFHECYGSAVIELDIDGTTYVTKNIHVKYRKDSFNKSIENMIDYIYDNCEKYLYEEHKYSESIFGIKTSDVITIDSRLSILSEIYNIYKDCYAYFRNISQTTLINTETVGNFENLHCITSNTITYIMTHPEELRAVNYNTGLYFYGQYYQPEKTLITSVAFSQDIYENQVIVGFIKSIIRELNQMLVDINKRLYSLFSDESDDNYFDSTYYIYTRNQKVIREYDVSVKKLLLKFQRLFYEYSRVMKVTDFKVLSMPKFTNIFKSIKPYRLIFEQIKKWFECGNYNFAKTDLLLSFISISKIYEYYCLIKLDINIDAIAKDLGLNQTFFDRKKYEDINKKYYYNTLFKNTFIYFNETSQISLFFQPVVYGNVNENKRNNIMLYRNTSISIKKKSNIDDEDRCNGQTGDFYTPDYIIKVEKDKQARYYIFDAKFSKIDVVKNLELPSLIYKYFFSISKLRKSDAISGLCFFCGKEDTSKQSINVYDIAEISGREMDQFVYLISLSGNDVDDDALLIKLLSTCISFFA